MLMRHLALTLVLALAAVAAALPASAQTAVGVPAPASGIGLSGTTISVTPTYANGWYAKDLFVYTRDANGAVLTQQVVASYNFSGGLTGVGQVRTVALGPAASAGIGMRIWFNADKSRNGTPFVVYSDGSNASQFMSASGTCTASGGRTDNWNDGGSGGYTNFGYKVACTGTATTGTGTGTGAGTQTGTSTAGIGGGTGTGTSVTLTLTTINGWYAKELFLFTRDANGAVATQMTVSSYNFGATPVGMNTPSSPLVVPAGSSWGVGLRVWANGDKSRSGQPIVSYSDTPGQPALTTSGSCSTGDRRDSWGDAGRAGTNVIYTLSCAAAATTGTGGGTGTGTNAGGTGTGTTGSPPGEAAPTSASILINRRSGNCLDAAGNVPTQQICRDLPSQNWTFVPTASGYQIKSTTTGQCLAVQDAVTGNGPTVVQQGCSTAANALFRLRKLDAWVEIVPTHSGRCISGTGPNENRNAGERVVQWDCDTGDAQRWTVLGAEGRANSGWTAPRTIGIVPVAGTVLPNGKVLFWAAEQRDSFTSGTNTWTTLYDPATNQATDLNVTQTGSDMFCPGTNLLPDGRVLVTGGLTAGNATAYDPATNTWSRVANMNITRGYNASTTLSTGDAFTFGGSWSGGVGNKDAEIWSSASNSWRVLRNVKGNDAADPSVPVYPGDTHYWLFASSNGSVFHAGPSTRMHWITTSGDGSLRDVGPRGTDRFSVNGTATLYDIGKIYKAGGAPDYNGAPAMDTAYTIDIGAGPTGTPGVAQAAPMLFARAYMNSVVLPDGDIVSVGGQNVAAAFTDNLPVMTPEIWSPKTGKVRRLAPMAVPRTYHSLALLLLDGRVLVGGGGLCGGCGGANHLDFEILSPPYLYDGQGNLASRPSLTQAPTSAGLGGTLAVTTNRAVTSFSLVRLSSVTHSTNNDQRRVPLAIASAAGTSYQLTLPSDPGILLPGTWMLFAMDANGVPSTARVVRIR
ncbi:RICIN domain-containing protein [Methylobacterium nonmethylotrophicum]|uniref:DUF1929 domain-containing protein n=1 Tax=Methylobacterium nonmethylotrophicum TaxID=1141884 RepID=A0A4Z0NVC9_9HYPH|nr:RICIN domain-containing protein [Methylobacterium nonmethylotrophicum]TGE01243.1 DUF1929 domain-containing protein [Methylobacterium nonmethylotrophicum]